MANPAHEAVLRQGTEEWNAWRACNGSVTPDLTGLKMTAARLEGTDFSHAQLEGATLIRARMEGADFSHANLRGAQLHEAHLEEANLYRARMAKAVLAGAKLMRANLRGVDLEDAQMTVVDFRDADLREAMLKGTDLRESMGRGSNLYGAFLGGAVLFRCILAGADLSATAGLSPRQIDAAFIDDATQLPDDLEGAHLVSARAFYQQLDGMKSTTTGETVSDTEIARFHDILERLAVKGIECEDSRILESDIVQPLRGTAETSGWVDSVLFRQRIDEVLERLRKTSLI
jgi:uncharacterized protein YjbI with pentapeptide repeats